MGGAYELPVMLRDRLIRLRRAIYAFRDQSAPLREALAGIRKRLAMFRVNDLTLHDQFTNI